jgi:hypothetical protein
VTAPTRGSRIAFWTGVTIGGAVCGYGLHGLIPALHGITSRQFLQWYVGADVAHDLVVAPAACLVGVLVVRVTGPVARAPVRAALFATAIVVAVAWAPLRGYGRAAVPDNPSVAPLDYSTAVPTAVAVVWAIAAAWLLAAEIRRRRISRRPGAASCTG